MTGDGKARRLKRLVMIDLSAPCFRANAEGCWLVQDNLILPVAEGRRESAKFGNTDDEDLAGSGEVEGSAGEVVPHRGTASGRRSK